MSDISNQLIKDSYDYVLQSDLSTGIVYRIGGGIPVNPTFLSGLTINSAFTFADGSEQNGYVLTSDASGNASWKPVSAATPSSGVTSITVGNGLSANSSTGAVTIVFTGSTGISGDYLPLSGGTVTGDTIFELGLTATTISATTYYNLPVSAVTSGTGISASTTDGSVTIINTAPDQVVTITGGTNIDIVSDYPNFGINFTGVFVNPTNNFIPFNNDGVFSDSFIINEIGTNRLYTEFNSVQEGINLQYDDDFYKFGQFSNNYLVSFDVTNDETILRNPINNIYFTGNKIFLKGVNYDLSTTQIELDTNEPYIRLGNYSDPQNSSQKNGIYITPPTQNVWIGTFDDTNGDKNNGLFVSPTNIILGSNQGTSNIIQINNTPTENVEIAGNLLVDSTSTTLQQFQGQFASGTKMVVSDSSGTLSLEDKPIGISNGTVYYFNASVFQTGTTRTISPTPTTAVQTGLTISVANGLTGLIGNFLTPLGNPNANTIPPGIWSFYLHLNKSDSNASFRVYCEVFKRTSGGTEISLFTTSPEVINTVTPNIDMYVTDAFYGGITANTSDRILVKVYAQNTGNQTHSITLFTEGTTYYSYATFPFVNLNILTCDTLPNCSTIQALLPKSGGTITGNLSVTGTTSTNILSATTYQNLPTSATTFVTGFTYSANTFTIRDNSGSTFNASINTVTGLTVNGNLSVTGTTSTNILSATTYQNLPTSATTFVTGFTYSSNTFTIRDNSGSTFNATINTVTGLTVNGNLSVTGTTTTGTISATTYQNLPTYVSAVTEVGNVVTVNTNTATTNFTIDAATGGTFSNGNIQLSGSGTLGSISLSGNLASKSFGIVIDGGGATITTGIKGDLVIPYNMTISSWTILADTTGSTVVDIWKSTYANFPSTSGNTIVTGGTKPNISNGIRNQSVSLTGWNPTINSGDILRFNVDSASTITRITLTLNGILI